MRLQHKKALVTGASRDIERATALQLAPHNIKVNTFAIGTVETYMTADARSSYLTGSRIIIDGGPLLMRGYGKPETYKKQ